MRHANSQPQAAPTTYTVNNAAASRQTPTAEGMNPPHGQQNHRCDICSGRTFR
jgi:hypothetical protein